MKREKEEKHQKMKTEFLEFSFRELKAVTSILNDRPWNELSRLDPNKKDNCGHCLFFLIRSKRCIEVNYIFLETVVDQIVIKRVPGKLILS